MNLSQYRAGRVWRGNFLGKDESCDLSMRLALQGVTVSNVNILLQKLVKLYG